MRPTKNKREMWKTIQLKYEYRKSRVQWVTGEALYIQTEMLAKLDTALDPAADKIYGVKDKGSLVISGI